jgi:hypothetical protein
MKEAKTERSLITNDEDPTSNGLSVEEFKQSLPKQIHKRVSKSVMDSINLILTDTTVRDHFRENLLSYTNVLQSGKFKIGCYVDAVKYVSYKLLGYNNQESYQKTFPGRVTILIQDGATEKSISAYVAAYNRNKLVNLIWEQTLIPSFVLNAELYQKAINTQAHLMLTSTSDKVQCEAANSLLHHLKPPGVKKIELDIGMKDNGTIAELKEVTAKLAEQQKKMIEGKQLTPLQVAHSSLVIDGSSGKPINRIS